MAAGKFSVSVNIGGKLDASLGAAVRAADAQISTLARSVTGINTRTAETVRSLTSGLSSAGRRMQDVGRSVSTSVSAPLGMVGALGFDAAYQFEKTANAVQAVGSLTDDEIGRLRVYTKELNALFPYTNGEIMGAAEELSKAGFNFEQVVGSLKSTLNLGLAGDIELRQASDIASNIMSAMNLPRATTEEASASLAKVVDALAYAANRSNTDVRLLGDTFRYVAPMARAAGLSINDVAAFSMVMANSGEKGASAGVAMRSALVRMARPTKPMLAALERLNINLADFVKSGREVSSLDIIGSLNLDGIDASGAKGSIDRILASKALQADPGRMVQQLTAAISDSLGSDSIVDADKLSDSISAALTSAGSQIDFAGFMTALRERGATIGDISRIFDSRQGSRLITLLLQKDLAALGLAVGEQSAGAADAMSAIRMKGIVGDLAAMTAAWENLWVTVGESGALRDIGQVFRSISAGLEHLSATSPTLLRFATWSTMATIALGPFLLVAGGAARVLAPLSTGLLLLGNAATFGLAARLTTVAGGVRALAVAAALGAAGRLRTLGTALALFAVPGGAKMVFGSMAAGLASLSKKVLLFPVTMLKALVAPLVTIGALSAAGLAAIALVFVGLGMWIANNWQGIKTFFEGFGKGFRESLSPEVVALFDRFSGFLRSIFDSVSGLVGPLGTTTEQWRSWGEVVGGTVANAVNAVASAIQSVIGFLQTAIDKAVAMGEAVRSALSVGGGMIGGPGIVSGERPLTGGAAVGAMIGKGVDGARAAGGPVWKGGTFLVGENGPELFTPSRSGNIVPNDRLGLLSGRAEAATASRGRAPAAAPIAGNQFHFHINGAQDPHETARIARKEIDAWVRHMQNRQRYKLHD